MEQEGLNGMQVRGQGRLEVVTFENAVYKSITLVSY